MERERKGGDGITGKSGDTHTLPLIERAGSQSSIPDPNYVGVDLENGLGYPATGLILNVSR
jgi:hypothetical protein